jgi:hypothetical protein
MQSLTKVHCFPPLSFYQPTTEGGSRVKNFELQEKLQQYPPDAEVMWNDEAAKDVTEGNRSYTPLNDHLTPTNSTDGNPIVLLTKANKQPERAFGAGQGGSGFPSGRIGGAPYEGDQTSKL